MDVACFSNTVAVWNWTAVKDSKTSERGNAESQNRLNQGVSRNLGAVDPASKVAKGVGYMLWGPRDGDPHYGVVESSANSHLLYVTQNMYVINLAIS